MQTPTKVSIIIACRDEIDYIEKCLQSIVDNDYPNECLEVLVCDGMSDDGTREVIDKYSETYPWIQVLDNVKKITPCAFNLGIQHSSGDVIILMGAHCLYAKDYISKCVSRLIEHDADNVGGVLITKPRTGGIFAKAIASVLTSPFAVGDSKFRTVPDKPLEVDTVFGGCYRKSIFDKIGLFNENLIFTQDMEFNLRLKGANGKILLFPDIKVEYFARSSLVSFIKKSVRNGFWRVYPFKFVNHMPVQWRHLIPLVFVLSLLGSYLVGAFFGSFLIFDIILISYFVSALLFSFQMAQKEKNGFLIGVYLFLFPGLHISYGIGSLAALARLAVSKQIWQKFLKVL